MARDYNCGIYKIENTINKKCYIGQSTDIKRRWKQHKNYNKNFKDYPLYRSFEKYGIKNFKFTVLEYVENFEELTDRENFWYHILKPEYNQKEPSSSNVEKKAVYKIDLNTLEILDEFCSIYDAYKKTKIHMSNISKVCNKKLRQTGGFAWCFKSDYSNDFKPIYSNPNCRAKRIVQIKNKKIIRVFQSIREASDFVGVHYSCISKVLLGKRKSSAGFQWKYLEGCDYYRT